VNRKSNKSKETTESRFAMGPLPAVPGTALRCIGETTRVRRAISDGSALRITAGVFFE